MPSRLRIARFLITGAVTVALIVAIAAIGLLLYGWQNDTTYRGVQVAGADLSGLSQEEAAAKISEQVKLLAPQEVQLTYDGQSWTIPVSEMGVGFDPDATARDAFAVGRSGNLWRDSRNWLDGLIGGREVPVVFTFNQDPAVARLHELAPGVTRSATNADYVFASDGSIVIDPGLHGIGIDVNQTLQDIRKRFAALSNEPVQVSTVELQPAVSEATLKPGLDNVQQTLAEPVILTLDGAKWEIPTTDLKTMISIAPDDSGPSQPAIRREALSDYIAQIEDQIHQPGKNAGVTWRESRFEVVPSVDGIDLDVDSTVDRIIASLAAGDHQVDIAVETSPAVITDADAAAIARDAEQLVAKPVTVSWNGGSADLTRDQLATAVRFEESANGSNLSVSVDAAALQAVLEPLRSQIDVAGENAELRYFGGQVQVVSAEVVGTSLNTEQSATVVAQALEQGQTTAQLVTDPVNPAVTAAMAGTISIPEMLSAGETYYAGSVANRKFNVELAVERANGALIPPGGTYSFVETVGDVDLDSGYKVGYGIVGTSNGSVSTVPSVGGGICQVSTTMFHAAFWAGMPIVERNWHLYWIPTYGQQPSGLTGLDATVDTDYGLDFKFRNATENWLAVVAWADGSTIRFELWGTNPGWNVAVDDPVVSNVVRANTEMQFEESDQLPSGQSVFVESAQDGFDVGIHRRVTKGDEVIDDVVLNSYYRPSNNVTLVGTGS